MTMRPSLPSAVRRGFTLPELLAVIFASACLMAYALPEPPGLREAAVQKDAEGPTPVTYVFATLTADQIDAGLMEQEIRVRLDASIELAQCRTIPNQPTRLMIEFWMPSDQDVADVLAGLRTIPAVRATRQIGKDKRS